MRSPADHRPPESDSPNLDLDQTLDRLSAELSAVRAELARLRPEQPITTWQDTAAAVGVSVHTLMRRRHDVGHKGRPYFDGVDAARAWYADVVRASRLPPEPVRSSARRPKAVTTGTTLADVKRSRRKGGVV